MLIFLIIEGVVFFLVSAITMNYLVGVAVVVLLFDILYLGRWLGGFWQFIIGIGCIFMIIAFTIWPLLYMFIESGLPSFFYGLQQVIAPIQQFQSYLTPEYWTFSQRQTTVYEQTTDDAGVPPNIDFIISTFEAKPSSNVVFDQSITLWMTVENAGDRDLDIIRGFRSGWIGKEVTTGYPCPCEILRREEDGWGDFNAADYLQDKLWDTIGMEFGGSWSIDSESSGFEKMESGINARPIDFAKLGRLYLENGNWNGTQIVPREWVLESTQIDQLTHRASYYPNSQDFYDSGGYYKYMWWGYSRNDNDYDFAAEGDRGQMIYVSPQKKLIIVRNGFTYGDMNWLRLTYQLASQITEP